MGGSAEDYSNEPTVANSDTLKPLDPDIMERWRSFMEFAKAHRVYYPDYLSIYLWEKFKEE